MKIKTKRMILMVALIAGAVWNCLCLLNVLPFSKWPFSLAVVCSASLLITVPLLFPAYLGHSEKSAYIAQLEKKEKIFAGAAISLFFAWCVTLLACLVL